MRTQNAVIPILNSSGQVLQSLQILSLSPLSPLFVVIFLILLRGRLPADSLAETVKYDYTCLLFCLTQPWEDDSSGGIAKAGIWRRVHWPTKELVDT